MGDADLKVSAFETSIGELELENKCYDTVSNQLKSLGLTILYENHVITPSDALDYLNKIEDSG